MNAIRRPINYYGSKERMCRHIHRLIPEGPNTWVDLFCGSAIVTLAKPRHKREVINDRHGEISNLFDVLRGKHMGELFRRIELTPYAEDLLYRVYEMPPSEDAVERAWRFLVSGWFGRGGDAHKTGFRWSKSQTTAPEIVWARLPERLRTVAQRLRGVCIRNDDALKILGDYDHPDCIVFVDPPYPGDVGRRYAVRMSEAEHRALADRLKATRAKVILTMNPDTLYGEVLAGWTRTEVLVQGGGNASKPEVIYTNFEPPQHQGTLSFMVATTCAAEAGV